MTRLVVLVAFILGYSSAFAAAPEEGIIQVVAQYQPWYWTPPKGCPITGNAWAIGNWRHWDHDFGDFTNRNACNFVGGTTWLRDTNHVTYPLIGPYSSDNTEVMRWHIRLAKAAGITAFLVSVHPASDISEYGVFKARFLSMLQVAAQENFKLGLEFWAPGSPADVSRYYTQAKDAIDAALASPHSSALYKVNNLPVAWTVFWSRWDTNANLVNNLLNTKQVFWLISGDLSIAELNAMVLTNGAQKTQVVYNNFPQLSGDFGFNGDVSDRLVTMGSNGYEKVSHTYPGFNEAGTFANERIGLRNDSAVLSAWFDESVAGGAKMAIIESWNDSSEMTHMEPGFDIEQWVDYNQEEMYWTGTTNDPYRPLRILASYQGLIFSPPVLQCSIVDPVLVSAGMTTCSNDTTPPTAPTGLQAQAISSSQINLGWNESSDPGGAIANYLVERCTGVGCSDFTQVAVVVPNVHSDIGLTASTTYSYRVRAVDTGGNLSGYSSIVIATTAANTTPTGLLSEINFVYKGAFKLCCFTQDNPYPPGALAWNPTTSSLIVPGHGFTTKVAEYAPPLNPVITNNFSLLPEATRTVAYHDLTSPVFAPDGQVRINGMVYFQRSGKPDKVFWMRMNWYNVTGTDEDTLGASDWPGAANPVGLWHPGPRNDYRWHSNQVGGYLFQIPDSIATLWGNADNNLCMGFHRTAGAFGGSTGPTILCIDPWATGSLPPVGSTMLGGTTVLRYPRDIGYVPAPPPYCWELGICAMPGYGAADTYAGAHYISIGSKQAVVIAGIRGLGQSVYITGAGWTSAPYERRFFLYDVDELTAFSKGQKAEGEVDPYLSITLPAPFRVDGATYQGFGAMAYDPVGQRIYVLGAWDGPDGNAVIYAWDVVDPGGGGKPNPKGKGRRRE